MNTTGNSENIRIEKPPVLIIGCGGTGQNILRLLLEKYLEEISPDLLQNLPIGLLAIDTTTQEGKLTNKLRDEDYLSLGPIQLDTFLQQFYEKDDLIKEWFSDRQYAGLMSTGAMQIRAFGRLALFLKVLLVADKLEKKIRHVLDASHTFSEETKEATYMTDFRTSLQAHIIGNIGGGTGSGIMMDVAYLLRYLCPYPLVINAHLVMPELVSDFQLRDSIFANSYAFLKELDNFNLNPELYAKASPITQYLRARDEAVQKGKAGEKGTDARIRTQPFDYTYILSPFTLGSACLSKNFLYEIISEKLFLASMNEIGDREYERLVNIRANVLLQYYQTNNIVNGKLCAYSSYGVSSLRVRIKAIQAKIRDHILKKAMGFFGASKAEEIDLDQYPLLQGLKNNSINKSVAPALPSDANQRKQKLKDWLRESRTQVDKVLHENRNAIQNFALDIFRERHGVNILKVKRPGDVPERRLSRDTDIDVLPAALVAVDATIIKIVRANIDFYFYDKLESQWREVAAASQRIRDLLETMTAPMDSHDTMTKDFDNILFYNFPIEQITDYIEKHGGEIEKLGDVEAMADILTDDETSQNHLESLICGIIDKIWNGFAELWNEPKQAAGEEEKRLTVSNFLKIMFGDSSDKLDDILRSYQGIATPCWRYNEFFSKYVTTISLIGCKDTNYLFNKMKGMDFFGSTLEATGHEEDPFEIPLVISQHGLPLLGFEKVAEYRDAYQSMKAKFMAGKTRFTRQFHLDKRWENDKTDPLIDPFQDVPDSYIPHFNGQLFVLTWFLGWVRETNNRFFFKMKNGKGEVKLNPGDEAGPTAALTAFIDLFVSTPIEEGIKQALWDRQDSDGESFRKNVEAFLSDLATFQKKINIEEDKATMGRLIQYGRFFVDHDFQLLPTVSDKMPELIAAMK